MLDGATGHRVAEEAPEAMLAALTPFLAPYRERRGDGARVPITGCGEMSVFG